jgi:hypothetical protein
MKNTAKEGGWISLLPLGGCLGVHNGDSRGNSLIRVGAVANVDSGPNLDVAAPLRRWIQAVMCRFFMARSSKS